MINSPTQNQKVVHADRSRCVRSSQKMERVARPNVPRDLLPCPEPRGGRTAARSTRAGPDSPAHTCCLLRRWPWRTGTHARSQPGDVKNTQQATTACSYYTLQRVIVLTRTSSAFGRPGLVNDAKTHAATIQPRTKSAHISLLRGIESALYTVEDATDA